MLLHSQKRPKHSYRIKIAGSSGQDIMRSKADDHSIPCVARRAETQPSASDSPPAFSSDTRFARRGLMVCFRSHDVLTLCHSASIY